MGGAIEESAQANEALAKVFPAMIAMTLIVIVLQVRSLSMMAMVLLTAPLGVIGVVPILLAFDQPFGFTCRGINAIQGQTFRASRCGHVFGCTQAVWTTAIGHMP
jgi:Cu/Ag efflux pump CusA